MNDKQFEKLKSKGAIVELDDGQAAYVFPVGFRHLTRFTVQIQKAIRAMLDIEVPKSADSGAMKKILGLEVIPIILNDLMGLVKETTVLGILDQDNNFHRDEDADFEDLSHWEVPALLEEWFDLSFGEERKWTPWVRAVEKAILRLTGKTISLKEMFSKASSSSATPDTISSSDTKPPMMESASLIEDGP